MQRTQNYDLCQWAAEDRILRSDFNADNQKIDAALAGKTELVTGTYTGNGAASRTISLGFTPKAVFICDSTGLPRDDSAAWGGLALPDFPAMYSYSSDKVPVLSICEGGFTVYYRSFGGVNWVGSNGNGSTLFYIAVK